MHCPDRLFQCLIPRLRRFQYNEDFLLFNNFPPPPIHRLNCWNNIRTGRQFRTHHCSSNLYRLSLVCCRDQDN